MLYRKIVKNNDDLSILGFGCMRLPMKGQFIDEARAIRMIRYAVDRGVNYLDTAWPYHGGESEPLLGKALAEGYRDKVKVATKLPTWLIENRSDMDYYLNKQLGRLKTEQIDYYLLHALNGALWENLKERGVIDFMEKARSDGRIVNMGFSFHGLNRDFQRIVDEYSWVFCQIQYNFLDQENQAGKAGLEYAAARDIGVVVMEPLRGGSIGSAEPPTGIKEIWELASVRRTPADWALRWVWNHPEVTVVLSGMNDDVHLEENLATADEALPHSLSTADLGVIDHVARKYQELMKIGCTGCGYCMPCPEGVKIPEIFELYNKMHLFGDKQEAGFSYALRMSGILNGGEPSLASLCVACGECLEKCPQGLDIPGFMENVVDELEGLGFEERLALVKKMFQRKEQGTGV